MSKRSFFVPLLLLLFVTSSWAESRHKTENVFLITTDGVRWQEVFSGMEEILATKEFGVWDTNRLRKQFWRETDEARREALMPFFWQTIAGKGQLYGNGNKGSIAIVTNGKKFTYPGFNEIFTGSPDPRIDKNEKRYNPNVSVLEWLHQKPAFKGKMVGFANWDVHPYVLNTQRSGIPVWSGVETNFAGFRDARFDLVQELHDDTLALWGDMSFDSFYFHAALEYVRAKQPRLVWLALSEPDEWAHEGQYAHYLNSIHNADRYIGKLWAVVQAMPRYKDKTSFIIACDHGRGAGPNWRNHGADVEGAERVWQAWIGPDTPPLGERTNIAQVTHSQIAATIAALLGEDYRGAVPRAGAPIAEVFPSSAAQR